MRRRVLILGIVLLGCRDTTGPVRISLRPPHIMDGPCVVQLRFYVDSTDRTKGFLTFNGHFNPCPDTILTVPDTASR